MIPYGRQQIEDDDIAAVSAALRGDFLTTGPLVEAFDSALAAATGARFAVSCNSGTAALHMALLALGMGEKQAAIVPAITFAATANAVRFCGGEPVFADVDPDTGMMGPDQLREALARARQYLPDHRVTMVLPVHLAGQCSSPAEIAAIAAAADAAVVEDACHALGTRARNDAGGWDLIGACAQSAMACFSFHPVKTIAMGEGGAVTTNDAVLAERLRRFRSHGITRDPKRFTREDLAFDSSGHPNPWYYEFSEISPNYRAPDILCALGISQLAKLNRFGATRRALAHAYDERLAPLAPLIRPMARTANCDPLWHLYAARLDFAGLGLERAAVMRRLAAAGIGSQVHYVPLPWQPYYAARPGAEGEFPGAAAYYAKTLSLPLYAGLTAAEIDTVVTGLAALVPIGASVSGCLAGS